MRVNNLALAARNHTHFATPRPFSVPAAAAFRLLEPTSLSNSSCQSSSTSFLRLQSRVERSPQLSSCRASPVRGKCLSVRMAAAAVPVEVLVKAATGSPDKLGDCPFSQRVLLTLEEKSIPYNARLVDTSNKPAWFLEANPEGKVPVILHDGNWVADSDVITEILEKKFPEPSLAAPPSTAGSKLFGAFVQFLISKDPTDGKEQALLDEVKALDAHLKSNGPYINGEKISSLDLALAPKLYHLEIALGHYKNWSIPAELTSLHEYIQTVHARESFQKTKAPKDFVVKGWESKVTAA